MVKKGFTMSNSIEHIVPEYITNIVGVDSGDTENNAWFKISGISGTGISVNYPSFSPDGEQLRYDHKDYWQFKKKVLVQTIRLNIKGNAVSAERWVKDHFFILGICDSVFSKTSSTLDINPCKKLVKIEND